MQLRAVAVDWEIALWTPGDQGRPWLAWIGRPVSDLIDAILILLFGQPDLLRCMPLIDIIFSSVAVLLFS